MSSENLFVQCKACGKDVSKLVKICPQCGAKQKKMRIIHWIGIMFLGLIIISIFNTSDTSKKSPTNQPKSVVDAEKNESIDNLRPQEQILFINVVSEHARKFESAKNELQQSSTRDQRKLSISKTLSNYSVTSWIGTINQLKTDSDGNAILSVKISSEVEVKTWNNALSDIGANTLIEKGLDLYASLFDLSLGQQIEFSGSFFPSEVDHIKETSMTINGSMRNPEFLFKFQSVKPIN
jgi:hypothetical protein